MKPIPSQFSGQFSANHRDIFQAGVLGARIQVFVCPLKSNRLVDDSNGKSDYQQVSKLTWSEHEQTVGKTVKIKKFPKNFKVKLFQVAVMEDRMDYIVTNDITQNSSTGIREVTAYRWRIEQFHREVKQTTGIERCQCRKARIQRNHIACCVIVWMRMKEVARNLNTTIYRLKQKLSIAQLILLLEEKSRMDLKVSFA